MHSGRQRASVLLSTCVSVSYARKPHVLRDITLSMGRGEVLGLVGQSGSGKSTLALAILGLLDAKSVKVEGSIEFQGCDLLKLRERELRKIRGRSLGLVLQSPLSSLNPALKIRTQLREAWRAHAAGTGTECEVAIRLSLASVSLPADEEFLRRRPSQLSVGQAQRVLIAMTIMHHPALLIADEATSALDVMYYTPPTSTDVNTAKGLGASNGKAIGLVKGYGWAMSQGNVSSLISKDSNIKYVSLDRKLQSAMNYAVPAVGADIALSMSYDGTGVGVAVIDSGVNSVFDLTQSGASKTSRIVYSQNFDPSANTTNDLYGHGTHVAGIIAGNGGSSSCGNCDVTFRGIAPNANIINLRALDQNGSATDSTVIAAIQQAIALKNQYNIKVINLSLGRGVFESYTLDPLDQAVEQAWNAGIVVVVAAGNFGRDNSNNNNGYGTITAPGNDPYVITVGAMKTMETASRADDLIATYSSKGPTMLDHVVKPDLVAPGNLIVSDLASTADTLYSAYPANLLPIADYTTSNNSNTSSTYYRLSGTSMAAPMVSGAAALLLQQNPLLTPDQVKARLLKTAYKVFRCTARTPTRQRESLTPTSTISSPWARAISTSQRPWATPTWPRRPR